MTNALTAPDSSNVQKPCLCILAIDVSGSMAGNPIDELNRGLQDFYQSIDLDNEAAEKLEICIITFGSEVKCIQEPAKIDNFRMPTLVSDGTTKLVDGVKLAIKQVELRKEYYKTYSPQYSRPMIIVITDGEPDTDQDILGLYKQIENDMYSKKYTLHVLGTTGCNYSKMSQFCPKEMIYQLNGLDYSRFFKWLSKSTDEISSGKNFVETTEYSDFMQQSKI